MITKVQFTHILSLVQQGWNIKEAVQTIFKETSVFYSLASEQQKFILKGEKVACTLPVSFEAHLNYGTGKFGVKVDELELQKEDEYSYMTSEISEEYKLNKSVGLIFKYL